MRTVAIVILDRFADWEPAFVSSALTNEVGEGFRVVYASTDLDPKVSIGGLKALPETTLREVPGEAEGVIFIGADGSWHKEQKEAEALAKDFRRKGKVVAGICDAARWLASIGLLNDVKHTGNFREEFTQQRNYTNAGGYQEKDAVLDNKVVTANGNAPVAFAGQVLRALKAAPEEKIREYTDFYTLGLQKALKKYGYID